MEFASLDPFFAYLKQPNPLDNDQQMFELLHEQLLANAAPFQETVQAVFDLCESGLVVRPDLLQILSESFENGPWPPEQPDDADVAGEETSDNDGEQEHTAAVDRMAWLECVEAAEQLSVGRFSLAAITAAVCVALAPPPTGAAAVARPPPKPDACATFAMGVLDAAATRASLCKPCRHALGGSCMLTSCAFEHDLSSIPCRHWMDPRGCAHELGGQRGCPFAHGETALLPSAHALLAQLRTRQPGQALLAPDLAADETSFPALHALGSVKHKARAEPLVAENLLLKFIFQREGASRAREQCSAMAPQAAHKTQGQPLSAVLKEWVEGGKTVAEQYATLRAEAKPLLKARNALLERATRFYRSGQGAAAKQASLEATAINVRLHAVQQDAAKAIFSARNSAEALRKGLVDLHGLHVSEVDACLRAILPQLAQTGVQAATVLTGSGHHSHGTGRLRQLVQAVAAELELPLTDIKDAKGYTGGYSIGLSSLS